VRRRDFIVGASAVAAARSAGAAAGNVKRIAWISIRRLQGFLNGGYAASAFRAVINFRV
jgi:hypothetical protein